jgi:hypothetical protein
VARVLVLVVIVVLIAFAGAWLLSEQDDEGGERGGQGSGGGSTALDIQNAQDFDPGGDGEEHSTETALAWDGNDSTGWTTEDYEDPFEVLGKNGVGLVFDLGRSSDVATVELRSASPGLDVEIRSSDELGDDEEEFDVAADGSDIGTEETFDVDASGRYWLVWITGLPGDVGTAEISEVRFFAP